MKSDGLYIEHNKYGQEIFNIDNARYSFFQRGENLWEFIVALETTTAVQRSKELEKLGGQPNLEVSILLRKLPLIEKGAILEQKQGYDDALEENLTAFYYFEHESIENLKIEIFDMTKEWIDAQLTGETNVNGSDWRNPDAKVVVRTKFKIDNTLRRSFQ
jgi:hypothetical protein